MIVKSFYSFMSFFQLMILFRILWPNFSIPVGIQRWDDVNLMTTKKWRNIWPSCAWIIRPKISRRSCYSFPNATAEHVLRKEDSGWRIWFGKNTPVLEASLKICTHSSIYLILFPHFSRPASIQFFSNSFLLIYFPLRRLNL